MDFDYLEVDMRVRSIVERTMSQGSEEEKRAAIATITMAAILDPIIRWMIEADINPQCISDVTYQNLASRRNLEEMRQQRRRYERRILARERRRRERERRRSERERRRSERERRRERRRGYLAFTNPPASPETSDLDDRVQ